MARVCSRKKEKYLMAISSITRWMVSEYYNSKMGKDIRANGSIIKNMAMVNTSGPMDASTKEVIPMEKETAKARCSTRMKSSMKGSGSKVKNMVKESIVLVLMNLLESGVGDSLRRKLGEHIYLFFYEFLF